MTDMSATGWTLPRTRLDVASAVLRVAVSACLAIDAYVHLADAGDYTAVRTSALSQATLFRTEGVVAAVMAAALLVRPRPRPRVWAAAGVVLAAGVAAVVLYTYVNVGQLGPVPNMYEPSWVLPGKTASAWAEGIGAVLATAGFLVAWRRSRAAAS